MSKSIRFLTDKGFSALIDNVLSKYPFLTKTESSNRRFVYLTFVDIKVVYFDLTSKRVTFSELGFTITFRNGTEYSQPISGSLEDILTRKTLLKRLDDSKTLIEKYYYGS